RLERAQTLLVSPKFRHRVFRKLGGRTWLQRHLQSTRREWRFPPQSSGRFGDQTFGRWLNLRRDEADITGIFAPPRSRREKHFLESRQVVRNLDRLSRAVPRASK